MPPTVNNDTLKIQIADDELANKLRYICATKLKTVCEIVTIKAIRSNYSHTLGYAIVDRNSTHTSRSDYPLPIPGIVMTLQSRYMAQGKLICQIFDETIYTEIQATLLTFAREHKVSSLELTRNFN